MLLVNWPNCEADKNIMDHLFNYIREELSVFKVNIITPTFGDRTPLVDEIIQGTNQNFVSNNLNYENLTLIQDPVLVKDRIETYGFKKVFERNALTMGIIESKNGSSTRRDIFTMLKYFHALNPLTRGKYILNIITDERITLKSFFQKAWSQDFLDLTVLQWIQNSTTDPGKTRMMSNSTVLRLIIAHSYNPFNRTISEETLTRRTEIFQNKLRNLYKFPLTVYIVPYIKGDYRFKHYLEDLCWYLNCEINLHAWPKSRGTLGNDNSEIVYDLSFPPFFPTHRASRLEDFDEDNLMNIYLPITKSLHFYLKRRKTYETMVSHAALVTFGGLIFIAWIFSMWAYLLNFKERNWSFLNILTAQMGGSIVHHGQMKLSEMIFQMSIYIATFIILTLGADYMFEIFVIRPTLSDITTIKELADSNIDLVMNLVDYTVTRERESNLINNDSGLSKIFNRTRTHVLYQGYGDFCALYRTGLPYVDESINLCTEYSHNDEFILRSDKTWKINKILDPIVVVTGILRLGKISSYKDPLQAMIYKLAEIGLLKKWDARTNDKRAMISRAKYPALKIDEDEEVPLQDQLPPILFIGCILGTVVLIFELIWKRFIEKTKIGKLANAFYRDMYSGSAVGKMSINDPTMPVLERLIFKSVLWKFDAEPIQVSARKIFSGSRDNNHRVQEFVAEIHHHDSNTE
ncbi:hypothetical protein QAD02_019159 [Eretmocerus hayati]|uniref:Uncharacterized protein n=1 Tax=Eretmocerus hayati TaxID=131215 RepID=A0ACC2PLW9_9HYME|nr:hypothetical protein QAD02_019159 [Eretmocerus hayati]